MYAIIVTGGKQYRAEVGDTLYLEKIEAEVGTEVTFDQVLLVGDKVGTPYVEGAKVVATVEKQGRGKKIIVFKMKPKKNERKKQGHRQPYTKVEITAIKTPVAKTEKTAEKVEKAETTEKKTATKKSTTTKKVEAK